MSEEQILLVSTREVGEDERRAYLKEVEMRSLLETLGLKVVYHISFTIKEVNKTSFFGKGQIEEITNLAKATDATEVVIDSFLSPKQEMKIEEALSLPVSDREAVILAIFLLNAHSKEAKLQIKRAEAIYQKPRLIFREANYSQQRGGVRGAKGEGEKQIELERRTIEKDIQKLEREIESIKKNRVTQHKKRERNKLYSFALAGYTNAGKTTILNTLAPSAPKPEDKLFATLDTTTRLVTLPSGKEITLSDTVGFIRDLPPLLIEAFSSTIEEALSADGIIIVADASHPDSIECFKSTIDTLTRLSALDRIKLVVINKIDSSYDDISLSFLRSSGYKTIETNMKDKEKARETIIKALEEIVSENYTTLTLTLPYSSPLFSRLSQEKKIKSVEYKDDCILVVAEVPKDEEGRYAPYH